MSLIFENRYSFTSGYDLWITYMYYAPDLCGGDGYRQVGWYRVPPGGQTTVFNGSVKGRYFPYHAECHADGATWSGDIQGWVSDSAYNLCHGERCTPCRIVGFRSLQVGDFDNFIQPLDA
jgi:uncharacterized membrane protein